MLKILKQIAAPLISLFFFTLGSGLFTTLLSLRLHHQGASVFTIGIMSAAFYTGLIAGSFRTERFIVRVGHIRAFATFTSALAVISMVQGLIVNDTIWILLRLIYGFATAGLYIVIESWFLGEGTPKTRGQIVALYMLVFYAGQALGQFLINIGGEGSLMPFALTTILCSLSIIPISMTFTKSPPVGEPSTLNIKKLFKASATGVIGCMSSGLMLGALYGLLPLFVELKSASTTAISTVMAAVIFGGMALQYPIGKLSDTVDRRTLLLATNIGSLAIGLLLIFLYHQFWLVLLLFFIFGGMTFTLYPISISLTCDNLQQKDIIAGTQGLLLAYSVGSALGPIIAPVFMKLFGSNGLLIYFCCLFVFLIIFIFIRLFQKPPTAQEESPIAMTQTTPVIAEFNNK